MATQVQNRRGTTAEHSTFTGAVGELTVDTTKDTVVVHDGAVAGGRPLLREDQSNLPTSAPTTGLYNASGGLALSTGGSGRLFVDASGRVGISEASPATFDVRGAQLTITNATSDGIGVKGRMTDGFDRWYVGYNSSQHFEVSQLRNNQLVFKTNNTERVRVTNDGLVGVGTSSPSAPLSFAGSTGRKVGFYQGTEGYSIGVENSEFRFVTDASGFFTFRMGGTYSSATEFMRLDSSGRLGVGTTSPAAPLDVNGAIYSRSSGVYADAITAYSGSSLAINAGSSNLNITVNASERLRIDSSGRVGIGTSSPGDLVTISDSTTPKLGLRTGTTQRGEFRATSAITSLVSYNSSPMSFIINDGTDKTAIHIDGSQRVGIGTTSVSSPLHVKANSSEGIRIESPDFAGIYGLLTSRRSSGSPLDIAAVHSVGALEPEISFSRSTNGSTFSESARFDKAGRLLVGTSSASGGTNAKALIAGNTNSAPGVLLIASTSTTPASGDNLGVLRFSDAGHVHAGFITCDRDGGTWTSGSSQPSRLTFSTTADGASSPTERMRITNSGTVAIGDTSGATRLVVKGEETLSLFTNTTATTATFRTTMSLADGFGTERGSIKVSTTGTQFNTSSDYRLKENVVPVSDGIARLQRLKPSRFNFIGSGDTVVDGFIAHEVQTVVPEAVAGAKDEVDAEGNPKYQGIDQSKLVPLLTAALQEAVAKIESLEARLTAAGI